MSHRLVFHTESVSNSDIGQSWTSKAGKFQATTDIPVEFAGLGNGFSPEDYFALALSNCFIATFKVIASKSKLSFETVSVNLELILDLDENQRMIMKEAQLKVILKGAENQERALRILEKTTKSCMILNSVKTNIIFNFELI